MFNNSWANFLTQWVSPPYPLTYAGRKPGDYPCDASLLPPNPGHLLRWKTCSTFHRFQNTTTICVWGRKPHITSSIPTPGHKCDCSACFWIKYDLLPYEVRMTLYVSFNQDCVTLLTVRELVDSVWLYWNDWNQSHIWRTCNIKHAGLTPSIDISHYIAIWYLQSKLSVTYFD